jgi:hypothetical protein
MNNVGVVFVPSEGSCLRFVADFTAYVGGTLVLEHYKVLGAVLALKEFTVNDLARYTDVKPNTVRTTLSREQSYIEEIGKEQTGKRGGQHRRLRVKADQVENLRSRIDKLFGELKASPEMPQSESKAEIPIGLVVAEDILVRRYPEATTVRQRRELLELAEINLDAGRTECENLIAGNHYAGNVEKIEAQMDEIKEELLGVHVKSIEGLMTLSRLEYDLYRDREAEPGMVHVLHQNLTDLSGALWRLGESNHNYAFGTMQRVANSPVINRALRW